MRILFAFLTLIFFIFLVSCDKQLSKIEAKEVIIKTFKFPLEKIEGLRLNYPTEFDTGSVANLYKSLSDKKLIKTTKTTNPKNAMFKEQIAVELTVYGMKFIADLNKDNNDSSKVFLKIGSEIFNNIDSVVMNKNKKEAHVYFTTKLVGLTPFGKAIADYKENMTLPYHFDLVKKNENWKITYEH